MRALLMAVLAFLLAAPSLAEEVCTLGRIAQIPFETDDTGHIYVPATFAGQHTRLLLDTGAYWSGLSDALVQKLNLEVKTSRDVWMVDLSGEKLDKYVTVPEMTLGDIAFTYPQDLIVEHSRGHSVAEYGGSIGLNFLARWDLEIDNAAKTISLFTQDHCVGAGVHWADEAVTLKFTRQKRDIPIGTRIRTQRDYEAVNMPIVGAQLEGETVRTLFDTGSTFSLIDLDHAKRRFGIGPGTPGVTQEGVAHLPSGNTVELYRYTFKTLTISGIRFENVPVKMGKFEDSDLILGMNELKHLHLYFAFKDAMIHITAADAGR